MYYIGIDIGGMSIKGAVVTEKGEILKKSSTATLPDRHYSEIISDIAKLAYSLISELGLSVNEVSGVGIGIPGTIDGENGFIVYSNNINFEHVPIVAEFKKHINLPVKIGNDANCAALGEVKFGSGKGVREAVFVTLGTGVGSGIVTDGKLLVGKGGAGAEAGHSVIRTGGERCTCGRKGCWEAYASASALIRQTARAIERDPSGMMAKLSREEGKISGRTAFKAARAGDAAGKRVVASYIKFVGEGLVNLANIFRPEMLIIGGGISNEGDYLIERLQKFVDKFSYGGRRNPNVTVKKAELLNDAGVLGAAALVME